MMPVQETISPRAAFPSGTFGWPAGIARLRQLCGRVFPDRMATQSSAILVGSIILAHLLFGLTWMFLSPETRATPDERAVAIQVGMTIRIIATVPADRRQAVVDAASTPFLRITREARAPEVENLPGGAREPAFLRMVRAQVGPTVSDIVVGLVDEGARDRLVVAAHESDDWLVFREAPRPRFHGPLGVYTFPISALLLIGIPLLTLSLWAARKVTSPLAHLALATETLSLEGGALPIPANAAVEIRKLAGSFNALVERLQKFAADRSGMLAAISHDLRTPLTRLRLRADALPDDAVRTKMLRDIRAMDVMITSTMSYVEQQHTTGALEPLDLAALLQTLCDEFVDSGYDVTYEGPLHCPAAARPNALERALNNLIENAIKFGTSATLVLDSTGPALVIDVCDDGPGVSDAEKGRVMKPFYRSDASRNSEQGGIGLGLAIANAIAERHDGSLELLDRQPHGLCVRMRLPKPAD